MGRTVKVSKEIKKQVKTEFKRRLQEIEEEDLDMQMVYYEEPEPTGNKSKSNQKGES